MKRKHHYVYRIDDPVTNQYYFGSRSSEVLPKLDVGYMGSYVSWKPENPKRLIKTIIKINFKTRENAIKYEAKLIRKNIDNSLCMNKYIPDKGFHVTGVPINENTLAVKDRNGKIFRINKSDPRYLNCKTGKLKLTKDRHCSKKRLDKLDEKLKDISGELVPQNVGKIWLKDSTGKISMVDIKDKKHKKEIKKVLEDRYENYLKRRRESYLKRRKKKRLAKNGK